MAKEMAVRRIDSPSYFGKQSALQRYNSQSPAEDRLLHLAQPVLAEIELAADDEAWEAEHPQLHRLPRVGDELVLDALVHGELQQLPGRQPRLLERRLEHRGV